MTDAYRVNDGPPAHPGVDVAERLRGLLVAHSDQAQLVLPAYDLRVIMELLQDREDDRLELEQQVTDLTVELEELTDFNDEFKQDVDRLQAELDEALARLEIFA